VEGGPSEQAADNRPDDAGDERIGGKQQAEIDSTRHDPRGEAGLVRLRFGVLPPDDPLEPVVKLLGDLRQANPDVGDQSRALRGDRSTDLRRLGDPLDELLGLL
jgi:hypothetical protein